MKIYQVYQWIDSLDGESEDSFLVATFESKEDAEFCVNPDLIICEKSMRYADMILQT